MSAAALSIMVMRLDCHEAFYLQSSLAILTDVGDTSALFELRLQFKLANLEIRNCHCQFLVSNWVSFDFNVAYSSG